jgi:type III restriction enzyme
MPSTITNPILNAPFREPTRHFRFDEDGITSEIVEGRRLSSYFVPIPAPKKKGGAQLSLGMQGDWTVERQQENGFINDVRRYVTQFRRSGYPGVTSVTRELLRYWTDTERAKPLFFCQIEALETAIYLTEVAAHREPWIEARLREENEGKNPGLYRIAFKMATGSGKTVVMAMLIAWQALNKLANPQDKRFSDTFLVVTPGITIRDRLRVLLPNDPGNYYAERDLVTSDQLLRLQQASILVTNFHAFLARETLQASTTTKKLLVGPGGDTDRFRETPDQVVRRVCRSLGNKRNIVVLNDEAHHCYQSAPPATAEKETLSADERAEVNKAKEEARVWLNGLRAVKAKLGIRAIFDLSATPFFLRGSGYPEGTLFPWVVSDFALIDAIEAGVVKVPRVPVADDTMATDGPVFRELWPRIRDDLPRKGREAEELSADRKLPAELEDALRQLYANYDRSHRAWRDAGQGTPPVFIVVCQNTAISKLVFDWIAGYERTVNGTSVLVPGNLVLFSNVAEGAHSSENRWIDRPNSLLIDSAQLESGEAMDPAFKRIAAVEIEEFKRELLAREPHRAEEEVSDEDLLREVMNTVGKRGRLGEQVRCVVSVSMLTEGWDANTVTHILGVRAFGTQLLCEQVVGRGLRRVSYEADADGMFEPEYAEVYGVPFSFIPTTGSATPVVQKEVFRVFAQPDKAEYELTFPHLQGYRFDLPTERLTASFDEDSVMVLSTQDIPTWTEMDPIVGEKVIHRLDDLRARRLQEVAFRIARRTLDRFFRTEDGDPRPWLFPQLVRIAADWLERCVVLKDGTFPQMLLLAEWEHHAAEKVYRAIVVGSAGEKRLLPILRPYDQIGSTRYVDFTTTKSVYPAGKSHLNWLVMDSDWEAKVGQMLDELPEVRAWVKNQGLGLRIPYTLEGESAHYLPDLLVRIDDGGPEPLNLLIEVTGERKKDKAAKVETARSQWAPAVNNDGRFGRWAFLEITDPWDAANLIRSHLRHWAGSLT